jgi:hypothetical protein
LAKLFLHVGFHKTGTTSLQDALNRNRAGLLTQGLFYPKTKRFYAQHEFAWSVGQRGGGWKEFGGSQAGPGPARRMFRVIRSSKQDVIISSEFLSELTPSKIQKLVSSIGDKDLRVIFTVRPLAKILPSAYQQEVKNGSKLVFDSWLERVLEPEKENRNKTRFWTRHSHNIEIAKWAGIVGKERITVIVADESKPEFLTDSFFKLVHADTSNFVESEKEVVNRSMDLAEIELLRRINEKFDRNLGWDEYVVGIRNTLVKTWTGSAPSTNSPGRLANPSEFKEAIEAKALEVTLGIRSLGVNVIGDVESLSRASFGSNQTPEVIDIDNLVLPILSRTREKTLKSYKLFQLVRIVLRRLASAIKDRVLKAIGIREKGI